MKKKLNSYRGRLSPAQIAAGMNAAAANAYRLASDAERLLDAGSFATAASIAILAIEEAGKVSILRALSLAKTDAEAAESWSEYRSHTKKNATWLLPQLAARGATKLDDLKPMFDEASDHPFVLDQLKQVGFYTDCLGKANWAVPSEVIDETLARGLVGIARLFAHGERYVEKDIQLWVEHVGPVWKRNPEWMKQAVINWYAAMQVAGLRPQGTNEMKEFVRQGLKPEGN